MDTLGGSLDGGSADLARTVHRLEADLAAAKHQQERSAQGLREEQFNSNRLQVGPGAGRGEGRHCCLLRDGHVHCVERRGAWRRAAFPCQSPCPCCCPC
jgi:hypothetical protein